ncbi:uncharacterized protein NECHADRAFT_76719 [Fusarium vanettenii 77-13-4]|uniref:HNH nuclease domain-containing protein n=1 Tax=Fusarium vanettenii (strain ATCC MYA-4622 / CBS 123669 / FGSC 9596 / NRRL 45880 / 77-13-4) TaxID=660122 RepID=C7Z521_FUSV7|nr:uncharacterized protein NECHADRAFT_76719 [Fusarium vanettenii 77-13-4]EEU40444.1 hypothetical protein NECHADRAFT_76719 [Fusarium vanettenii 77-13-4]
MADPQDEEVAIRTKYALKIQNDIQRQVPGAKDFRLNNVHLAMFASAPLSILQPDGMLGGAMPIDMVHHYLEIFPPLVKHFLARWSDKAYNKHLTSRPNTPAVPSKTLKATRGSARESSAKALEKIREQFQQLELEGPEEDEIEDEEDDIADMTFALDEKKGRNSSAISGCKKRDSNKCVLTSASDPEVCHIVPFSWNSTRANIKKTQCVYSASAILMGVDWTSDNLILLANPDAPGGSDHVWNTICMNPLLHKWWAQAFFGLKCLGILEGKDTSIVEVQFRWMPRSKKNPMASCCLTENNMNLMLNEVKALTDGGNLPATPKHGKIGTSQVNLRSGYTFRVEMPPEDAGRFKDMLDLQWACIVIAALSGAARYPHLLPDHPRWGDSDIIDYPYHHPPDIGFLVRDFGQRFWAQGHPSGRETSLKILVPFPTPAADPETPENRAPGNVIEESATSLMARNNRFSAYSRRCANADPSDTANFNPRIRSKKSTETSVEVGKIDGELDDFHKKQRTNVSGTLKSR